MKTVSLNFNVPEGIETTSENLAAMRQLLLSALAETRDNQVEDFPQLRKQHPELMTPS